MTSEWMKVMLDEIARKSAEESEGRAEAERREGPTPGADPRPNETPPDP